MLGLWLGKLADLGLRLLGRRATSLPGKVALKFSPRLLVQLGRQLTSCTVVTGTNGKTTTASLLAGILRTQTELIHNTEGANMEQGLATAMLRHVSWFGNLRSTRALFEIDEATLPLVMPLFPVRQTIVTNVFRDQLDRYGEVDTTMSKIIQGLTASGSPLILNADDPLAHHVGRECGTRTVYYGMDTSHLRTIDRVQMRDGVFCLECGTELDYEGYFYGQLGVYRCPTCEFGHPEPDYAGRYDGERLTVTRKTDEEVALSIPVRGMFNVYNALAAVTAAAEQGIPWPDIETGLAQFAPPLGRMQAFATHPTTVLNLVKNPTGCDSVLQAISSEPGQHVMCIAINDLAADGRDVSWLWDADFELIPDTGQAVFCVTTGMRAEDMGLRLKYAGYPSDRIKVIPTLEAGIDEALRLAQSLGGMTTYVIATYTNLYPAAAYLERKEEQREQSPENRPSVS